MAIGRDKKKKKGGRRRNYEPTVHLTGIQKILPTGWGNWGGFLLFGFLAVAMVAEFFVALGRDKTDWVGAIVLSILFAWIAVLFAITRWKDYV